LVEERNLDCGQADWDWGVDGGTGQRADGDGMGRWHRAGRRRWEKVLRGATGIEFVGARRRVLRLLTSRGSARRIAVVYR
jgi:hypothetical protein